MCGIFGYIGPEKCASIIRAALKRLEYRGYDSVGIATIDVNRLFIKKDAGKIDDIHSRLNLDDLPGKIGIGHTRWATHGAPSRENAHPHTDCKDEIAVVHNGIIENFLNLYEELKKRGHSFKSRTDTEVIPHLIEEKLAEGLSLLDAVRECLKLVKGSYAILVISVHEPDKIVCARKESPLVIGIGEGSLYCASDVPAFLPLTNKAVFLEDDEIAVVRSSDVSIFDLRMGIAKPREVCTIDWTPEAAEKEGYPHFMLKEIHDQPRALRDAMRAQELYYDLMASILDAASKVFLIGCGTSYHACLAASYLFSRIARLNAQPVIASEFIERYGDVLDERCAVIAVSQSGETADVLSAVRSASERKAKILGITNVMGSSLTRLSTVYIGQQSGPEIGVAATKTFTAQLVVLAKLAIKLAERRKSIPREEMDWLKAKLEEIPEVIEGIIERGEEVRHLVRKYHEKVCFCFLGRGISVSTAMEGRLKLLELAYVPSISYPAAESKHGFIALVEEGFPIIFVAPRDQTHPKIIGNIMEMKARGGKIIALIEEGDEEVKQLADDYIEVPRGIPDVLSPVVYVIPLQLFAYHMAVEKGYDPDKPRSLAKSVTVE